MSDAAVAAETRNVGHAPSAGAHEEKNARHASDVHESR